MDAAFPEDKPLAFQMAPGGCRITADESPVDDRAAGGQGARDDLAPRVGRVEQKAVTRVHVGALGRHDDGIEAGHGVLAVQGKGGVHGDVLHALEQDVVAHQRGVLFKDACCAGPDADGFTPVVDHGEGEFAAFFHIHL